MRQRQEGQLRQKRAAKGSDISVLLTACMRKLAQVPERLKSGTAEFQGVVAEARALEKGLIERVSRENASVVSALKDEMYRAVTAWYETITRAMRLEEKAHAMTDELKPVVTSATQIAQDFQTLKGDLKVPQNPRRKSWREWRPLRPYIARTNCVLGN